MTTVASGLQAVRSQPADPVGAAAPAGRKDLDDLRRETENFSALLLRQLLGAMRQGMPENPYFDKGAGSKTFLSLLDEGYADLLAHRRNGPGVADLLYRQLSRPLERRVAAGPATVPGAGFVV
jgi:Rod binding domain-containing protein